MKAILLSIKPKYVAKILNGEKTIEIRKRFPKDYVGWVYLYCTKSSLKVSGKYGYKKELVVNGNVVNGKVVARFWCDKVDNYINGSKLAFENGTYIFGTNADFETILKPSCLTEDELYDYCEDLSFKAIHITKLEIFDKPKELSEFYKVGFYQALDDATKNLIPPYPISPYSIQKRFSLTKAPQNFCYVESEE